MKSVGEKNEKLPTVPYSHMKMALKMDGKNVGVLQNVNIQINLIK